MEGSVIDETKEYHPNGMALYVENDNLICAPFGRCADPNTELVYTGVNPLKIDKWQHISCTFVRNKFVKGQFLEINMESDGT